MHVFKYSHFVLVVESFGALCSLVTWSLASSVHALWLDETNSQGLPSPVEEKGLHYTLSRGECLGAPGALSPEERC